MVSDTERGSEVGLVTVECDGTRRMYRARPEGTVEIYDYIEGFWN